MSIVRTREQLELWNLPIWPSDEQIKRANLDRDSLEEGDPEILHLHSWMEQVDIWLHTHAEPIDNQNELHAINRTYYGMIATPANEIQDVLDINCVMWDKHRVLPPSNGMWDVIWMRPQKGSDLPDFVRTYYNLPVPDGTTDFDDTGAAHVTPRPLGPPRPIVSPAFRHDGREGLGRISSSQISQGIFAACIAQKDTWGKTAKGFPRYTHIVQSGEIEITLRPEVESKDEKKLAVQIGEMEAIRDELSISDWDMACILMEQALTENGGHGTAYISDADACDYRKLEKNRKEGFAAGHHPDNRKRASDAINRLVHLWIRTDTLQVGQIDDRGKLGSVTLNLRERFVSIRQTLNRQDTEATIGWYYEFGRSFTTFLQPPNRFIAYLLQGTIALKSTQGSAKRVAHYIALRLKVDARNGAVYDITMGRLVEAAHLPYDEARIQRTIDQNEDTLRMCVREGLFRIKTQDGDILHSGSQPAMLAAWTLRDPNLKGRKLLRHWKGQKLLILAEPDIERRYDEHRGIGRTGKSAIRG